jgi:hypothetical protein
MKPNRLLVVAVATDGTARKLEIDNNLKEMQNLVGGHIECVGFRSQNFDGFCNEEGLLIGLEYNHVASAMFTMFSGYQRDIVGNVFFVGLPDHNGDSTSLTNEDADRLVNHANHLKKLIGLAMGTY